MMQFTFYVFFLLTRLFGLLPFWALHLLSNMCYFLFYYLIPYRKKVIRQNIQRSFPGLSKKAQTTIVKGFYRNFCDILIEGIRGFSISKKQLLKCYVFTNPEVMNELYEKGQDVVAVGAHYANWEWGIIAAPLQLKHKLYALYTPLSNTPMDGYLRGNRKKWGTELVPSREVKKSIRCPT
jgi:KDO2-lipid IV(A) lauroyltransferase